MNRQLKQERYFPFVLYHNFSKVIRPRAEILNNKVKHYELHEAFMFTDNQFCQRYSVNPKTLQKQIKLNEREDDREVDILWQYIKPKGVMGEKSN